MKNANYGGVKALHNTLNQIEPYNNYRAYMISGVAVFNKGESRDYYTLFIPNDGFKDMGFYPNLKEKSHLLGKNNILYVIGYDEDYKLTTVFLGE